MDAGDRAGLGGQEDYPRILVETDEYFGFEKIIQAPLGRHDVTKNSSSSFVDGKNIRDSAGAGKTRLNYITRH